MLKDALRAAVASALAASAVCCGGLIAAQPREEVGPEGGTALGDASPPPPDAREAGPCATLERPPDLGKEPPGSIAPWPCWQCFVPTPTPIFDFELTLADPGACDFDAGLGTGVARYELCARLCGGEDAGIYTPCTVHGDKLTCEVYDGGPCGCMGRRPPGLSQAPRVSGGRTRASHLAAAARLEVASVEAFRVLRRELVEHGAPRHLLRRASRAARDEARHARAMGSLARRAGGRVAALRVDPLPTRSLLEIATENAVEGCVGEAIGAALAMFQAIRATEHDVRAVMRKIARDEARHAALAYDVARWLEPRLSSQERASVRRARAAAIEHFRSSFPKLPMADARALGFPSPLEAAHMLAALTHALWGENPCTAHRLRTEVWPRRPRRRRGASPSAGAARSGLRQ